MSNAKHDVPSKQNFEFAAGRDIHLDFFFDTNPAELATWTTEINIWDSDRAGATRQFTKAAVSTGGKIRVSLNTTETGGTHSLDAAIGSGDHYYELRRTDSGLNTPLARGNIKIYGPGDPA